MDEETQAIFRQEAEELIASLETGLLGLETSPEDMTLVAGVFRDLHTLKGTGAMFGFTRLAQFVHDFEAAFDRIRSGDSTVTPGLVEVALKAHDLIVALLEGEDPDPAIDEELKTALNAVTTGGEAPAPAGAAASGGDAPKGADAGQGWILTFRLPEDFLEIGGNPVSLIDELRDLGGADVQVTAVVDRLPELDDMRPCGLFLGWTVTLPPSVTPDDIDDVFMFHRDQMEMELTPITGGTDAIEETPATVQDIAPVAAATKADDKAKSNKVPTVTQMRVSADRLDDIMDRVGELVIAEARLSELANGLGDVALKSVVEDIQRLALGLRDSTMAIRMTPLESIMGRFRRLARDLAGLTGKQFDFVTEGEQTELDKTVIEKLSDPLVHLLRNAVDHGLETPDVRRASGKPERGTVRLVARYSGADVLIEVIDDGKGLDPDFIRMRAVERGLITDDQSLSRSEIFALLLEPGFSTAAQVTELSGRGVGADVVKQTVEALRGSIEIESEMGQGSTFTLRLPLTLAIMDGLLVQVGDERYTIPLAAVHQIIELPEVLQGSTAACDVTEIRDELVSILRLRTIFDSRGDRDPHQKVVVVQVNDVRFGLVVDRIVGSYQTVIKQLSPLQRHMKAFSGATILGDGTCALILDVAQLVQAQKAGFFDKEKAA